MHCSCFYLLGVLCAGVSHRHLSDHLSELVENTINDLEQSKVGKDQVGGEGGGGGAGKGGGGLVRWEGLV